MSVETGLRGGAMRRESSRWVQELFRKEDWWAVWIGLTIVVVAVVFFDCGNSIKWLAVAPKKWSAFPDIVGQISSHALQYVALFIAWAVLLGVGARAVGLRLASFLRSFAFLFILAIPIFALGLWDQAARYSLEPPVVALIVGLAISNFGRLPAWMTEGFRVEYYIKIGIVLLGATLPLTLILWAGPVAIVQAAIISLITFGVIYFVATRLGLDPRLAATLGAGGAICGVSGAIAVAGAVGAKKEHAPIAIALVVVWAIVMVFILPVASHAFALPTGITGAWIGSSEFADATGLAAAQFYGGYAGQDPQITGTADDAVATFTLMKVVGRDIWIGVWAFVLSIVATTRWNETGVDVRPDPGEIWRRFPKFVLGFLVASFVITLLSQNLTFTSYTKSSFASDLVEPIKNLRTWAFTFCFLSIGLTTRFRDLATVGERPFWAFSSGVVVNVLLGLLLSTVVFGGYWSRFGH
ncbi:MAG TPA: putative sulfate exporter family transporter [Candidatus Acidoferrales bacterium]|nr:putative sulfate exporter family transporter [Candidatus Acidoferrales bacterium]